MIAEGAARAGAALGVAAPPWRPGGSARSWVVPAVAAAAAFAGGLALGTVADPLPLGLLPIVAGAALTAALLRPRWSLVVTLGLLVGYVPEAAGFSLAAHALTGTLIAAVLIRRLAGAERFDAPPGVGVLVVLVLAYALSSLFAADPGGAAAETLDVAAFAALVVLLVTLLDSAAWLTRAAWAVVVAAGVLAVLAILQQLTGSYDATFGGLATVVDAGGAQRSAGPLSPNFFGQVLAASAMLALYLAGTGTRSTMRWVAGGAGVACLVGVVYTQSRGALLAVLVATFAVALLRRVRLPVVVAVVCASVVLGALALPANLKTRIGDLSGLATTNARVTTDTSLQGRVGENLAALRMWADRPLLGVGPDNFEAHYEQYAQRVGTDQRAQERAAHSLYLESLAETGILGAVPFLAIVWLALAGAWQARRELAGDGAVVAEGILVALVAFLTCSLTLHSAYARYQWIFLGLGLAAGAVANRRRKAVAG